MCTIFTQQMSKLLFRFPSRRHLTSGKQSKSCAPLPNQVSQRRVAVLQNWPQKAVVRLETGCLAGPSDSSM